MTTNNFKHFIHEFNNKHLKAYNIENHVEDFAGQANNSLFDEEPDIAVLFTQLKQKRKEKNYEKEK